MLAQRRTVKYD